MTMPALPALDDALSMPDEMCVVQVMRVDGGELLATSWFVAEGYSDVTEKVRAVFGEPIADMTADATALLPLGADLMSSPGTHVRMDQP